MKLEVLYQLIEDFSKETHGSSDYYKEEIFVKGKSEGEFIPLKHLVKKTENVSGIDQLYKLGFVCDSYELYEEEDFIKWYEKQFGRKLKRTHAKKIFIVYDPDDKAIFDAVEQVHNAFEVLRFQKVLMNNKNLPVQLGEWYAKSIFGLKQKKSSSQRGFDFYLDGKRTEIKVEWGNLTSPKGAKIRKSLADLSDYCIVMYLARNFMIREICFLDSDFVLRKFAGKGHTIFLKDSDVSQYFFTSSSKHMNKVKNSSSLLKYSSPTFAMKIAENFSSN